jgi:hypothetical protein
LAVPVRYFSRLPSALYFITSRTMPSGASVQMPYTGRMWSWGFADSSAYSRRSMSMAAPSAQSVPLHLTATVSPRADQSMRATSPKAPLPRLRRRARAVQGTRGRRPVGVAGGALYDSEEVCR